MKAMLQRMSPQSAHEMIQFNLKQPKKQAKSCFTQAKKGRAVFTNVQSQGQASPVLPGRERRSPQETLPQQRYGRANKHEENAIRHSFEEKGYSV